MDWKSAIKESGNLYHIPERWLHLHYYEALNILFRVENSLRVFVYVILKNNLYDEWHQAEVPTLEAGSTTIQAMAKKRLSQAKTFGYLGYEVTCPIMHLSSGELISLITSNSYWKYFTPYFKASKEIITNKLEEIGTIRNSLAHFRPIKTDDVEVIKQNAKHTLMAIETFLSEMTSANQVVPTNTEDDWYKNISTLGNPSTKITLYQSRNVDWIRIVIRFFNRVLNVQRLGENFLHYQILNLISPQIIRRYGSIAKYCTYLSENIPYVTVKNDAKADFRKDVSIVFLRTSLTENHEAIREDLVEFLSRLTDEEELVAQDHLAKGDFLEPNYAYAKLTGEGEKQYWNVTTTRLRCPFKEDDPPEYWGDLGVFQYDFIAGSMQYPWMTSRISDPESTP